MLSRMGRLEARTARRALSALVAATAAVAAWPSPAHAVLVNGSFTMQQIDVSGSMPNPPPLSMGVGPSPGPDRVSFSYDTAAATLVGNRYVFTQSASLSLTAMGWTYTTTASASNPLEILVGGGPGDNDAFTIMPTGISFLHDTDPAASDPGNPVPAIPYVEMSLGFGTLPNDDLPTASFPGTYPAWTDPEVFLRSTNGIGPDPYYFIRWRVTSDVTITTGTTAVPEPPTIALLGVGLLALAGVPGSMRRRR